LAVNHEQSCFNVHLSRGESAPLCASPAHTLFLAIKRDTSPLHGTLYGVTKQGLKKSFFWFILFLPIMLVVAGLIQYFHGVTWSADPIAGAISFFEAFTEEFFFRGILFIFNCRKPV